MKPQISTKRWIIQFTATRGDMIARVISGAFGDTLEEAIEYIVSRNQNQYDSITDIREWSEEN